MALQTTVLPPVRDPREPVQHELDPFRSSGQLVQLSLIIRRTDDGAWRGRLRFTDPESSRELETAEIFYAASEGDLWGAVRDLRDHHLRDLYRSLD
jgi:hypothetical protein